MSRPITFVSLLAAAAILTQTFWPQPEQSFVVRSEIFGEVASGTIYTTILNQNAFDTNFPTATPRVLSLSSTGDLRAQSLPENNAIDFKKHSDGSFSIGFFEDKPEIKSGYYNIWNEVTGESTTLKVKDNANTDIHGLLRTSRGTYVLPSYKMHHIDNEKVESFLIEEQTIDGEVLFTWDSIDHIPISQSNHNEKRSYWIEQNINDYYHGNSIAEANDGNYLLSGRNVNQITKVDRVSGEVIWRLGGTYSDFTFIDDPNNGFSHQHSVSQLPNGNILLYDNANLSEDKITRVVEYKLDTNEMTATLVWSYDDGRFTFATGSVHRTKEGHTIIGWGAELGGTPSTTPRITELNTNSKVVMQIYFPDNAGFYNAFKY